MFKFYNPSCFICKSFFGPCYEDPTCVTCHAFFYPNAVAEGAQLTTLFESDSDSENDEPEPPNITHQRLGVCELDYENNPLAPSVEVEPPDQQLSRLSVTQHKVDVNIECLPVEVLTIIFKHLDDISLWSVGQVCGRWKEILDMHIRPEVWKTNVALRWPLLQLPSESQDWYHVYTSLMRNSWCIKCIKQITMPEDYLFDDDNPWRKHRLKTELLAMRLDPLKGIQTIPLDTRWCNWQCIIEGPIGSPYEGGIFFLYIQIPLSYPMNPPIVGFLTKIFHLNISRHGDIGIDIIHQKWSCEMTINEVMLSIKTLLMVPDCKLSMEPEIEELYVNDREEYENQARLWTCRYAVLNFEN